MSDLNQMLNEAYKAGQRDMRERAAQKADDWFYNPDADETEAYLGEKILNLPIKEKNEKE